MLDDCESEAGLLARVMAQSRVTGKDEKVFPQTTTKGLNREWNLPGLLGDARVTTNFGQVPAQLVRVRDHLKTRDGRFLPVLKIKEYKLDKEFLSRCPSARPVTIQRSRLGPNLPARDIQMSPAQGIAVPGDDLRFRRALAGQVSSNRPTFDHAIGVVTYFRLLLPENAEICCEGVWVQASQWDPAHSDT